MQAFCSSEICTYKHIPPVRVMEERLLCFRLDLCSTERVHRYSGTLCILLGKNAVLSLNVCMTRVVLSPSLCITRVVFHLKNPGKLEVGFFGIRLPILRVIRHIVLKS